MGRTVSFVCSETSWGKNSLVPIGTKFISTTTRIQRLRSLPSGNDAYIKVKRMGLSLGSVRLRNRTEFLRSSGKARVFTLPASIS